MRVPLPRLRRIANASLMEAYFIEHWARSRPSLTLTPFGDDRSTINRHLSGRLCLGITPTGLSVKEGKERAASCEKQATRCRLTSCAKYDELSINDVWVFICRLKIPGGWLAENASLEPQAES